MRISPRFRWLPGVCSLVVGGCNDPRLLCVEGLQTSCTCDDGQRGTQVCNERGRFDACECGPAVRRSDAGAAVSDPPSTYDPYDPLDPLGPLLPFNPYTPSSPSDAGSDAAVVVLGECASQALDVRPVDVEFSRALDRVVLVSASPNQLTILDPQSGASDAVELPLEPAAVSVSPDGLTAAVAHNAYVTIVDLQSAAVSATIATTSDASDIVLAGNGFAYVFPRTDQWVGIHSVEIATRVDHAGNQWSIYAGTRARLHPGGTSMYGITVGLSPTDIERYDISAGVASTARYDSPYHGDHPMCDAVWFSEGGERIFTGCGTAFRASPGASDDMTYAGVLGGSDANQRFRWITHASANASVYAIARGAGQYGFYDEQTFSAEEAQVRVYSEDFLGLEDTLDIPCLDTSAGKQRVHGRYVFVSADGASLYVLGQLDAASGALHDWALWSGSL